MAYVFLNPNLKECSSCKISSGPYSAVRLESILTEIAIKMVCVIGSS